MNSPTYNTAPELKAAIAALERVLVAVKVDGLALNAHGDAMRALGFARSLEKTCRFLQLEAALEVGDRVKLLRKGAHGRVVWFNADQRTIGIEREGEYIGSYEPEDVGLACVDLLAQWVAICERSVAQWEGKPGRDKKAPERLAGYQRQLARLRAPA